MAMFIFQTGCNVSVLLLSELVWEKFRHGTTFLEPYPVHFPDYSKGKCSEPFLVALLHPAMLVSHASSSNAFIARRNLLPKDIL